VSDVNANIGVNIDSSQALAELKALQRKISEFNLAIAKSNEAAALAQKSLQKNLINSINSIGAFSAELRTVNTTAESFTKALEGNKLSMREYFRYAGASTRTFGKSFKSELDTLNKVAVERVKTLQTQYIKLGRDANGAMKAIAVRPLVLDMESLATQTQIAAQKQALFNQLMRQGSTQLLNFGKNTQWAGRQLMVGFTLPLAAFGAAASKAFKDLETEVIKFRKVYGDLGTSSQETEKALEGIRALADGYTKYGVEVAKTVGVASAAAAAGFKNADLIAQTDAATKLAILGQIEQQQALETTISLQNAFKISSTELATTIDFLNAVENQTVTSLDDITTAIPKVAPVIQSLGGDVKDLAFFLTAMKEGGINASEGANALKSGLASLINPTNKATAMLGSMGINIDAIVTKNAGNLKKTVVEFAQELDKLDPLSRARAIETMFGKFQFARISTLLNNVTQQGTQASRVLDLASQSASNLASLTEKELGTTAESALIKFQGAVAKLKASLAPVGEVFMSAVAPILEFVSNVLEKFNSLSDGTKKFIAITVGVIGGLGPILLMTFGLLANGVANIIKLFMTLRNGYQRLTGQSQNLGEQTQYLTNEQLEAAAAAHSLEQSHARLTQQFSAEASVVNQLRNAYEQALIAATKFATLNPGMMKTPKLPGFANGSDGVIVRGPGTGTSDSILARVSNGEAIIPAAVVRQHPQVVSALVSGQLPKFASGDEGIQVAGPRGRKKEGTWRSVKVPGGYDASHFGGKNYLTGQQLLDMVEGDMSSSAKKIREMVGSFSDGLTRSFTAFDNSVVAQLREINQDMFYKGKANVGKVRSNLTSSTYAPVRDIELQRLLTEPQGNKPAVMSMQEFARVNQEITKKIQQGFAGLSDEAEITSDQLDQLIRESYEAVAETDARVKDAVTKMRNVSTVTDPRTSSRIPITDESYTKQKPKYRKGFEKVTGVGRSPYPEMTSFGITETMAAQAGRTKAEAAALYKEMSDEAKLRLFALRNDIVKFGEQFVVEVNTLGTKIGTTAVQAIAMGAKTRSPSEATKQTAQDIIAGLRNELAAQESAVRQSGLRVGQIAVDSIDIGVANGSAKKPRRVSSRAQGPAPIGPSLPSGAMMLPIVAALTEEEKIINNLTKKNKFFKKKTGGDESSSVVNSRNMMASMGIMAGSMALNMLPESTAKNYASSAMNFASIGAMFGPWGIAAGAAFGLASKGIADIIEKQRKLREMSESVFKSSASAAEFFGNTVVAVDGKVSNFNITVASTADNLNKAAGEASNAAQSLAAFQNLISGLPESDPLKKFVTGLAEETDIKKVQDLSTSFVAMQVATGQIKASQAQQFLDLILRASDHAILAGNNLMTFASQGEAVATVLKNLKTKLQEIMATASNGIVGAAESSRYLGETLVELSGSFSNITSLEDLTVALQSIRDAGFNTAAALAAVRDVYLSIGNIKAGNLAAVVGEMEGADLSSFFAIQQALTRGIDISIADGSTWADVQAQIDAGYKKLGKSAFSSGKVAQTAAEKAIGNNKKEIDLLEKKRDALDKIIKKQQKIADTYKLQNDYLSKQQDLDEKIAKAKMSGNYLEAANLEQEKISNTAQFNYDKNIADLTDQRDLLDEQIAKLKDNNTKLGENTSSLDKLGQTIKTWKPGNLSLPEKYNPLMFSQPKSDQISDGGTTYMQFKSPAGGNVQLKYDVKNSPELTQTYFDTLSKLGYQFTGYAPKGSNPDKVEKISVNLSGPEPIIKDSKGNQLYPPVTTRAMGGIVKHFEPGGAVSGPGTATSDSIPAMLSDGEYVIKAAAVDQYGVPLLHAINSQKFATGGSVQKFNKGGQALSWIGNNLLGLDDARKGLKTDNEFKAMWYGMKGGAELATTLSGLGLIKTGFFGAKAFGPKIISRLSQLKSDAGILRKSTHVSYDPKLGGKTLDPMLWESSRADSMNRMNYLMSGKAGPLQDTAPYVYGLSPTTFVKALSGKGLISDKQWAAQFGRGFGPGSFTKDAPEWQAFLNSGYKGIWRSYGDDAIGKGEFGLNFPTKYKSQDWSKYVKQAPTSKEKIVIKIDPETSLPFGRKSGINTGGLIQKFGGGGMPSAPHDRGMQWGGQGKTNAYQRFMLGIARNSGFVDKFFGVDSIFRTLAGKPKGKGDVAFAALAPLEGLGGVAKAGAKTVGKALSPDTITSIKTLQQSIADTRAEISAIESGQYFKDNSWSNPADAGIYISNLKNTISKNMDAIKRGRASDTPPGYIPALDLFVEKPGFAQGQDFATVASATLRSSAGAAGSAVYRALSLHDIAKVRGYELLPNINAQMLGAEWMKKHNIPKMVGPAWETLVSRWKPDLPKIPAGGRHPDIPASVPDSSIYGGYPSSNLIESNMFKILDSAMKIGEKAVIPMHKSFTNHLEWAKQIAVEGGTGGGTVQAVAKYILSDKAKGIPDITKVAYTGGSRNFPEAIEGLMAPYAEVVLKEVNRLKHGYETVTNVGDPVTRLIDEYVFEVLGHKIPTDFRPLLAKGGLVNVPKFHSWNGPIPGPYGQELSAVLKSGTEGVYQEDYMNRLRRDATMNTSTSNSNSVYNNNIVINGTDLNKKELADEVMSRLDRIQKSNNKSNKVVF
jgi:TP901 family phage tail tape measure protein